MKTQLPNIDLLKEQVTTGQDNWNKEDYKGLLHKLGAELDLVSKP